MARGSPLVAVVPVSRPLADDAREQGGERTCGVAGAVGADAGEPPRLVSAVAESRLIVGAVGADAGEPPRRCGIFSTTDAAFGRSGCRCRGTPAPVQEFFPEQIPPWRSG